MKIHIRYPKDKCLLQQVDQLLFKTEQLQEDIVEADKLYQQYIQELAHEAIPNGTQSVPVSPAIIDESSASSSSQSTSNSINKCISSPK